MTANQLQYWRNVETERHNRATEQQALLDYGVNQYDVYNNKALQAASSSRQAGAAESQADTAALRAANDYYIAQWNARINQERLALDQYIGRSTAALNQQKGLTEMYQRQYLLSGTNLNYEKKVSEDAYRNLLYAQVGEKEASALKLLADAGFLDERAKMYGAESTSEIVKNYVSAFAALSNEVEDWAAFFASKGASTSLKGLLSGSKESSNGMSAYERGYQAAYEEMYRQVSGGN